MDLGVHKEHQLCGALQGLKGAREEKVLTKFSDAVIQKDWMLAWTVKDILAEEVLPQKQAWSSLGLRSPPTSDTVSSCPCL